MLNTNMGRKNLSERILTAFLNFVCVQINFFHYTWVSPQPYVHPMSFNTQRERERDMSSSPTSAPTSPGSEFFSCGTFLCRASRKLKLHFKWQCFHVWHFCKYTKEVSCVSAIHGHVFVSCCCLFTYTVNQSFHPLYIFDKVQVVNF